MSRQTGLWAGFVLVVVGLIALAHNIWPWWVNSTFLWAVAVAVVAAGFFVTHSQHRQAVFLVLGWGTLGLAGTLFLNAYGPPATDVSGACFVLGWALGFLALHLHKPDAWWPALVGGTLFVLSAMVALAGLDLLWTYQRRFVFFFGMALVLGYIYLAVRPRQNRWAGVLSLLSLAAAILVLLVHWVPDLRDYAGPILLIALGIWLTVRGLKETKSTEQKETETAGPERSDETAQASEN